LRIVGDSSGYRKSRNVVVYGDEACSLGQRDVMQG